MSDEVIIDIQGLQNQLGGVWVHEDVTMQVKRGEILAIIGGSGSGKTTILRSILMLLKPTSGSVRVFGHDVVDCSDEVGNTIRKRWGMLFQHSALFSAMTVVENVMFPIQEFTRLEPQFIRELAMMKISMVGLPAEAATKYPAELSGGMQRRAAAARAIAMDPELLFLDEPTSGLDPKSAKQFDELVLFLRNALGLTVVMVSHDIASLKRITDRVAFIGEGRVLALEPIEALMNNPNPIIADYFSQH